MQSSGSLRALFSAQILEQRYPLLNNILNSISFVGCLSPMASLHHHRTTEAQGPEFSLNNHSSERKVTGLPILI